MNAFLADAGLAQEFVKFLHDPFGFGQNGSQLNGPQAAVRAVLVYAFAVGIVRLGNRRFLGQSSAFDAILAIVLGSTLSRAITGSGPLLPGLAACATLVAVHWTLAALTFRFHSLGQLVKGKEDVLVADGALQPEAMRRQHMTEEDVREALRQQGKLEEPGEVATARLERSGQVSVIKQKPPPRIVEVRVEAGVQTVRLEIQGGQ